ncbi:hypothetical protein GOP47_0026588 [Adiantum capillus-veneris]|nr:hypothetical protein GOP47_0026588 [Adiantum capillus-veneris]
MDGEKAQCRQGSSSNRSSSSAKQEYSDRFARMEFVIHPADKDTKTKGRYQRNSSQHININPKLQNEKTSPHNILVNPSSRIVAWSVSMQGTIDGGIGDRKVSDPHGFNDDAMALEEPDVQVKKVILVLKIDAEEVTDLQQSGDQDKLSHDAAEETLTPFHENRQQSRNVNMQSTQLEPQQNGSARYSGVPKFDKANESFDAAIGEEDIHDHNLADAHSHSWNDKKQR